MKKIVNKITSKTEESFLLYGLGINSGTKFKLILPRDKIIV
jgi:hypothetical protein